MSNISPKVYVLKHIQQSIDELMEIYKMDNDTIHCINYLKFGRDSLVRSISMEIRYDDDDEL